MKYLKNYRLLWIAVSIFVMLSALLYFFVPDFAKSNLYTAIATFIVGCFAIGLYIQQKIDQKRDSANVILSEIRYAEGLIDRFKTAGVSTDITYQLLPNNHWGKYNFLFIKDLDQDETTEINNFYNQCFILDKALDQISVYHELKHKSQVVHQTLSTIAKESLGNEQIFKTNKKAYLEIIEKDPYVFRADAPINAVVKTLNNIRFVTTSTAGSKLKDIAGQK